MGSFLLLLVGFLLPTVALSDDPLGNICFDTNANYSVNIPKVEQVLLSYIAKSGGYVLTSFGEVGSSAVYGLAQCRGDVGLKDCITCTQDAAKQLRARCPNQADARIWYDFCFLRYDTKSFSGQSESGSGILYWNINFATDAAIFERKLKGVMDSARNQALMPGSGGLGRNKVKLSPFNDLYGLAQCTGDLAPTECAKCLADAYTNFQNPGSSCKDRQGCRVLYSSCYVRYEIYPFYFPLYSVRKPTPVSRAYLNPKKNH